jgi:hypothetical protein
MSEELQTARIKLIVAEEESEPPFIKFKAYRYRHKLELLELFKKMQSGEATEVDDTAYVAGMVADWGFKDEDTGELIPVGDYGALSIVQHAQMMTAWNNYTAGLWEEVKKTNEQRSSSGSEE